MDSKNKHNNVKSSPNLKAAVFEHILLFCINGVPIYELLFEIQRILPLPYRTFKTFLFYRLIYELVSYNGQRQLYETEDEGFDLLQMINREKKMAMVDSEDIIVTI